MIDIDLLVESLRKYGHSVESVICVPDNAGEYELDIDGNALNLEEARHLLEQEEPTKQPSFACSDATRLAKETRPRLRCGSPFLPLGRALIRPEFPPQINPLATHLPPRPLICLVNRSKERTQCQIFKAKSPSSPAPPRESVQPSRNISPQTEPPSSSTTPSALEPAESLVQRIQSAGGKAVTAQADLSNPADIRKLISATTKAFAHLDILINNAGVYKFLPSRSITAEHLDQPLQPQRLGPPPHHPSRRSRTSTPKAAFVINISSLVALTPAPASAVYAGTKAAVDVITRVLAMELGPQKIRVVGVSPGVTVTEGLDSMEEMDEATQKYAISRTPARPSRRPRRHRESRSVHGILRLRLDHRRNPPGRRRTEVLARGRVPHVRILGRGHSRKPEIRYLCLFLRLSSRRICC